MAQVAYTKEKTRYLKPPIFAVAPMMEWTDRHCRVFHRLLTRKARLYTEMLTTGAIIHGARERLLGFSDIEHPVALQLGGSDPDDLAASARIGEDFGYDEINLNVGCPSDRVKDGRFGACLMAEPDLVAEGVHAMKRAVSIPVTVKCRIGIDDQDPEAGLDGFARKVVAAGADALIVHARKAWLQGLSPKENRKIPPLDYDRVYRLKASFPDLPVIINGGIGSISEAERHLAHVDGVMLGRAAYQEPWRLLTVDSELFGEESPHATMRCALEAMIPYIEDQLAGGARLHSITRHLVGAFHGVPGARAFRRCLAENDVKAGAGVDVLREAIALVDQPIAFSSEACPLARPEDGYRFALGNAQVD
jgi:tRNA-dihydrouridine synthase A